MKSILSIILLLLSTASMSQPVNQRLDSLKKVLSQQRYDSAKTRLLNLIGRAYTNLDSDSSLHYLEASLKIARENRQVRWEAVCLVDIGQNKNITGNLPEALRFMNQGLKLAQENNLVEEIRGAYWYMGHLYTGLEDYTTTLDLRRMVCQLDQQYKWPDLRISVLNAKLYLSQAFGRLGIQDSAKHYLKLITDSLPALPTTIINGISGNMGIAYELIENYDSALLMLKRGVDVSTGIGAFRLAGLYTVPIARVYQKLGMQDSAIRYATLTLEYSRHTSFMGQQYRAAKLLADLWEKRDPVKSLQYYKMSLAGSEALYGVRSLQAIKEIEVQEKESQQKIEQARMRSRQYMLGGGLLVLLLLALLLFYTIRKQRTANTLLAKQKKEVEQTLHQLKATQQQLIQSEKMASLGELTAGIAHEIQNPLNFINNFSDVNTELVDEAEQEMDKGNISEVKIILNDIKENEQKINHHGKRADAIVKGMLQHSRTSSGQKEPTDINALAGEYLRLAYHGLKAKDKSLNAKFVTDFDPVIDKINILPQDIGRVILNLINNAFYAVSEKKAHQFNGYEPTVTISTRKQSDKIEIRVNDNGGGIPQKVLDKIFQPFFTTKPTGQGTGLGLSLSYDIIKAHGGDIKVVSKEGEGSEFVVQIPLS